MSKVDQYMQMVKDFTYTEGLSEREQAERMKAGNELFATMTDEEMNETCIRLVEFAKGVDEGIAKALEEVLVNPTN